jgi:meckelin
MSMDIFLLDWERPKPATAPPRPEGAVASVNKNANTETTVSVWRTYLVANEWNEIQVRRKTALAIQIFVVVFILKVNEARDDLSRFH